MIFCSVPSNQEKNKENEKKKKRKLDDTQDIEKQFKEDTRCTACGIEVPIGLKESHEKGKKHLKLLKQKKAISDTSSGIRHSKLSSQHFFIKKEEDVLSGVYWILLTKPVPKRKVVMALPNKHNLLNPQTVAGMLKQLGFQAFAIHKKTASIQKMQALDRLKSNHVANKLVIVTTEHLVSGITHLEADLFLVKVPFKSNLQSKFKSIFLIDQEEASTPMLQYSKEMSNLEKQKLQARLRVAKQIVDISQCLGKKQSNEQDHDTKWANKFARDAGLDQLEEEGGGKMEEEVHSKKNKKKQKLTPDEQRLQALTEKLYGMLSQSLDAQTSSDRNHELLKTQADQKDLKEKLKVLGIVTVNASIGTSMKDTTRLSAQTQWMDLAEGHMYGGGWEGIVRHGASCDATSRQLRLQIAKGSKWKPNKEPIDVDKWGGEYGKACGHNEVVMQHLRPFFPQEVLNSRVCSKSFPAPGNQGFDGCLEFLQLNCREKRKALTVWDAEHFLYITTKGQVIQFKKQQFLGLSLNGLKCLIDNLRQETLACEGQKDPRILFEYILLLSHIGIGQCTLSLGSMIADARIARRMVSFLLKGTTRQWKHVANTGPSLVAS
jgi:hypothetical protein